MIMDKRLTFESWAHDTLSVVLGGELAAGDYYGDTEAGEGIPLPGCDLEEVHYSAATPTGGGTEITLHNVTSGESATFVPDNASGSAEVDLHFKGGDELAVEVTNVDGTTAGSDVSAVLAFRKYRVSSTQHGD